jgi:hypothetical protein
MTKMAEHLPSMCKGLHSSRVLKKKENDKIIKVPISKKNKEEKEKQ